MPIFKVCFQQESHPETDPQRQAKTKSPRLKIFLEADGVRDNAACRGDLMRGWLGHHLDLMSTLLKGKLSKGDVYLETAKLCLSWLDHDLFIILVMSIMRI